MSKTRLTWWPDVKAQSADLLELPWSSLVDRLYELPPHPKDQAPLIKFATFGDKRTKKGSLRHDQNVLQVTGVEGDYDSGKVSPEEARQRLEQHNLKAVVVTTHRHTPEFPRWRVLAAFSEPKEPGERRRYVAALNGILGGVLHTESFTLSQSFYVGPPPEGEHLVLPTFDDPEDGFFIDELEPEEIDRLALYPSGEGSEPTPPLLPPSPGSGLPAHLSAMLEHVGPDDYHTWVRTGMAIHYADSGEDGFAAWNEWSKGSDKYPGEKDSRKKWDSFSASRERTVGIGSLVTAAQDGGYSGPVFTVQEIRERTKDHDVDISALMGSTEDETQDRKIPPPLSLRQLMQAEEPEEDWLVDGLIPAGGNILLVGYPKTYKTMFLLELGIALASGTDFMGKFNVPEAKKVGIILMEDQEHRVKRRIERLCEGRYLNPDTLYGQMHFWFRPPVRLNENQVAKELAEYAGDLGLDFLAVDSWSYVSVGNSNSADEVTPQLQRLSYVRHANPKLAIQLTHHARKELVGQDSNGGGRVPDEIRGSGAFGAWYDTGVVLSRKDETAPVKVRTELRDFPAPDPFVFSVDDQEDASSDNNHTPQGWLRLRVSDYRPEVVDRMAAAENLAPAVLQFVRDNPGSSKRQVRLGVTGRGRDLDHAIEILEKTGQIRIEDPKGPGKPAHLFEEEG